VDKVVALSGVFGVEAGYFLDGVGEPSMLDREALDILRDEILVASDPKGACDGRRRHVAL